MSLAKTMNLFNTLLNAIDDPAKQASTDGLSNLLGTLQQLGGGQVDPKAVQGLVGIAGKYVRTGLQEQQASGSAQAIVNQYGGTQPSEAAVTALLSVPQIEQLVAEAEARTGLDAGTVRSLLPTVIPMVLALLKMGGDKGAAEVATADAAAPSAASTAPTGDNALLNSFLDTDGDGDLDVGDALKLASRFLR
ncbi:MAG: hypothetical protein Fur0042_07210 [Cyanophyceae cyanobacterium]